MVLYAVFYSKKQPKLSRGVFWELYLAFMGPVAHVELVFVKDLQCDCLNINMKCPDGYPRMERNRPYREVLTPECPYSLEWVKIPIEGSQEPKVRLFVEQLVQARRFQMCEREMLSSTLPRQLHPLFTALYTLATGATYAMPSRSAEEDGKKRGPSPQYCTGLCLHVLREACGYRDLPETCTASELRHRLVDLKRMEMTDSPYRQYCPIPIRDAANIKRARNTIMVFNWAENKWSTPSFNAEDGLVSREWGFAA